MWEGLMLICFGASWPPAIIKTVRVKNPAGKSFIFMTLILAGYFSGIVGKIVAMKADCLTYWVFWVYILDFAMVATDFILSLYYAQKNKKSEKFQKK